MREKGVPWPERGEGIKQRDDLLYGKANFALGYFQERASRGENCFGLAASAFSVIGEKICDIQLNRCYIENCWFCIHVYIILMIRSIRLMHTRNFDAIQ